MSNQDFQYTYFWILVFDTKGFKKVQGEYGKNNVPFISINRVVHSLNRSLAKFKDGKTVKLVEFYPPTKAAHVTGVVALKKAEVTKLKKILAADQPDWEKLAKPKGFEHALSCSIGCSII